jgi:outer membrane protein assembly factor BamB
MSKASTIKMIVVLTIVIWGFLYQRHLQENSNICVESRPDAMPRTVIVNGLNLINHWNRYVVLASSGLVSVENLLIFADEACNQLVALDLPSNQYFWTLDYPARNLVVDSERSLIYSFGTGKELMAVNFSGEQIWLNTSQNGQRGAITTYVNPNGDVLAYVSALGLVQVNVETGSFHLLGDVPQLIPELFYSSDGFFWRVKNGTLEAWSMIESELLWVSEYNGLTRCCFEQVYADSEIIVLHAHSELMVLNRTDGAFLWQYDTSELVSNFAIDGDKVYALDIDARLLQFDISTGEILGFTEFEPPMSATRDITESGYSIGSSAIAANDGFITIFFGDTDVMSVYQLPSD